MEDAGVQSQEDKRLLAVSPAQSNSKRRKIDGDAQRTEETVLSSQAMETDDTTGSSSTAAGAGAANCGADVTLKTNGEGQGEAQGNDAMDQEVVENTPEPKEHFVDDPILEEELVRRCVCMKT